MKHLLLSLLALTITLSSPAATKKDKTPKVTTVTVSSLKELVPYLKKDNLNLTMTPGTYRITAADVKAGRYNTPFEISSGRITFALLPFEGNNNTYDFTGVTIEVESAAINSFPGKYFEASELHTFGSNNVIKGIKMVDVGTVHDFPKCSWVNVIMDGENNRLEGVEINTQGSKPYGYGEVFGKGKDHVIAHKKHCGWLVRGTNSHVKSCRLIHRSYGHYMFMQAVAGTTTIEDCYIEGEMVSTDKILAEKGTGSAADKIGFKTVFGYTLPEGYTLSTGEDGIRTYGSGHTMIDGKSVSRETGGHIIIRNTTVKHARTGISLMQGVGTRHVENCTLIGCQDGFSINSGSAIINCRADAEFGPALRYVNDRDRNTEIDLTITPYAGENKHSGNGSKHLAHIFGSGHNVTLRRGEGLKLEQDMVIAIGGDSYTIGNLARQENYRAANITLTNETGYPVVIDKNASNVKLTTNGEVTDNGTGSTIVKK